MALIMRTGPLTGTFSLLSCLNYFKKGLIDITPFRHSKSLYSPSVLFTGTNNFGSVFPNPLDRRIYVTKFPTHLSFIFSIFSISLITLAVSGRFHPFIGHEGPQGGQRYSPTLFQTSALEMCEGSASRPGRTLPPGKTRYPLYRRLGGPQGRSGQVRKISPHQDSIL